MKIKYFDSFLHHHTYIYQRSAEQFEYINKISNSIQFVHKQVTKQASLRQFLNLPRDLPFLIYTVKSFQSLRAFKKKN